MSIQRASVLCLHSSSREEEILWAYKCQVSFLWTWVNLWTTNAPFLMGPPSFHWMGYYFYFFCFPMWWTTSKTTFEMTSWENLNLSHKLKIKYILSRMIVEKFELLTIYSPNYELIDSPCCTKTQVLPSNP